VALYSLAVFALCRALDETAIALALRGQGRLSFTLFMLGLAGPGIQQLVRARFSAWLARQRAAFYGAFALSHLIHGAWVAAYYLTTSKVFAWDVPNVSGLVTFPLLLGLLPGSARVLAERWPRAQAAIVAYCWVQFVGFFVDRLEHGRPELHAWYVTGIALGVGAAAVAWLAPLQSRSSAA
jgi:hypothetical protein